MARCDPAPEEVIVVDAGESAPAGEVVARIAADAPGIAWIHLTGTRGACRQRNRGIAEARGEILVFCDDDVLFERDSFARMLAAFDDPSVVGATGKLIEPSPRRISAKHSRLRVLLAGGRPQGTFLACGYPNRLWSVDEQHDVEVMTGCWMAARAPLARRLGFDEALEAPSGYASLDDEDFALRLSREGRLLYLPDAVVEHLNVGFSSANQRNFNRFLVRNRAYTFRKSFETTPFAWAQWWLIMGLHLAHRAINRDWEGLRGLLDGMREVPRSG
jgi:GT2 family glycosyltransferase